MSILSEIWRKIKGGRSDVQTAFSIIAGGLARDKRNELKQNMYNVQAVVGIAAMLSDDKRIQEASAFVDQAINDLEKQE